MVPYKNSVEPGGDGHLINLLTSGVHLKIKHS